MKIISITCVLLLTLNVSAQKSNPCLCSFTYDIKYPKKAQENNICGDVVVEMDTDSACLYSNPKVIKGIGFGCDEEALRISKRYIENMNKCQLQCNRQTCMPKKVTQKITFQCQPKEE